MAKLAVLTIRWPHLLSLLARDAEGAGHGWPEDPLRREPRRGAGQTVLDRLERAAGRAGEDEWAVALTEAGLLRDAKAGTARWDALRALLSARPSIAYLARDLL